MGYRLAEAARARGAKVVLISGPAALPPPAGTDVVLVRSAEQMRAAVLSRLDGASIVAMAAAVSDYRPATVAPRKIKKRDAPQRLELVRTPDILEALGAAKGKRFLLGFAAETDDVVANARRKLAQKRADLIVANDVSQPDRGFASDQNAATLVDAKGERALPLMSKRELADRIWDRVLQLRNATKATTRSRAARRGGPRNSR
jgi:phosphopantothenoylcysteine decarboxylase/phosphopantothenate--cysteine ligase